MIVVHAIWEDTGAGILHLWAESSHLTLASKSKDPKRAAKSQPHPFVLAHQSLRAALQEWLETTALSEAQPNIITLRLPTTAHGPMPSPELLFERTEDAAKPSTFTPWKIAALSLDAQHALDMLLAIPGDAPPGLAFGSDLRFWATAAMFAFELISRECYFPALQEMQQGRMTSFHAIWEALLAGEDDERMRRLASFMPPVCWSYLPAEKHVSTVPHHLLRHFLNHATDAFVRYSLADVPLLSKSKQKRAAYLMPQEKWVYGLTKSDITLSAREPQVQNFVSAMYSWLDQLRPAVAAAPFRTCFRLDAPDGESKQTQWRVSYYLQANDDRSLLVPADKIWKERSSTLTFLKRQFENPQERLLSDLGKASRLFPAIENSLRTARPSNVPLTTEQAYTFLRESVPLLEQSGFGVLVPTWWQKPSARVRVKLKMKPKAGAKVAQGLLGLDSIVQYDWAVSVGDAELTDEEFANLVNLKMPLVRVRGQWVELRPEEIEAAIAFFEKKRLSGNMTLGEALRLGLGEEQSEVGLQVAGIEAEGWIKELMDRLSNPASIAMIDQPSLLHGQLRPYQLKGVSWMSFLKQFGFGACLADDMGLGKCLAADSRIFVNSKLQKAEDIWSSYAGKTEYDGEGYWADSTHKLLVNAIDETTGKMVQAPIKRLYRQQVHTQLRKIRLEDGNSITITQPHKMLTDKGWTNNLHVGDYVCVPAKLHWEGRPEDPDLVKFLAWQIAEGHELKDVSAVTITQKERSVLEDLQACLQRISKNYEIVINRPSICTFKERPSYLRMSSVAYERFLRAKGYTWGNLSREKYIPDFIMQADLDTIRMFLSNFFEAEASVVKGMQSIEISTASTVLIQQLSHLLRRFGIWMRVSTKLKRATNGSGIYRPYQLGILGGNAARIFCQEIGFVSERKQQLLEHICAMESNTNVEGIPASEIMADVIATTKLPIRHFNMPTVYVYGSQQFSYDSLQQVIAGFDSILDGETERLYREKPNSKWTTKTLAAYVQLDKPYLLATKAKLQCLISQEVFYCKIKSIEDVPYDGWVYDFEVEQHHNFVAENILCHNTVQMISLILNDRERDIVEPAMEPSLLICPMSIVGNWQRELQRFAPSLSVMIHHGAERLSDTAFIEEARRHDIVITTYSLALRDQEHLAKIDWNYLVIDEAQNIKNEAARQTKAIKGLTALHRIALTGTPVENRLSELWSIMDFLNPRYLGNATEFKRSFATPIEKYHEAEQAETLKKLIQPFVLRRVKTDKAIIQDLPDKLEMNVYCNLTQEQASLYEAVVKEMMEKIEESEGIERRGLVLSTLLKLKQVCNHPAQFMSDGSALAGRSGKLARLEEMLEEVLAEGEKALIFTQFAEMGSLLRPYLQERLGREVLFLHGATPKKQRDAMVQRFQQDRHGPPIFLLSIKAGGVGLNLTAANHVFHFDRWWNPAVENQATDRAFRIGQQKNVQVHKYVCAGTLEERIDQMIEQKKGLAESIVGAGESWLTEMSTEQLKEMFTLSREAVGE